MNDKIAILIVAVVVIVAVTVLAMYAIKLMINTVKNSKSDDEK